MSLNLSQPTTDAKNSIQFKLWMDPTRVHLCRAILSSILSCGCRYGLKVDIWSAGVIAYILLCGFPPFSRFERRRLNFSVAHTYGYRIRSILIKYSLDSIFSVFGSCHLRVCFDCTNTGNIKIRYDTSDQPVLR